MANEPKKTKSSQNVLLLTIVVVGLAAILLIRSFSGVFETLPDTPQEPIKSKYELWQPFTPVVGGFSVSLPKPPRHLTETARDIRTQKVKRYSIWVADQLDASVYIITKITYPPDYPPSKEPDILENTISDMVAQGPENALIKSDPTEIDGKKGVKFDISSGENQIMGVTFLDGETLYILSRISKKENVNDEDFNHFVGSFKLNPLKNN